MIPTVQTDRLILRPFTADDVETLLSIYQTEGIRKYFPPSPPVTIERIQRFITRQQEDWDQYGYGIWGIVPKDASQVIGWVGLTFLPELNETEVGYLLDKPFWGKGFATEAARASLQFGFEQCGLDHIVALVFADNLASRRVIEKCGMTFEETIHLWEVDLRRNQIDADMWKRYISTKMVD